MLRVPGILFAVLGLCMWGGGHSARADAMVPFDVLFKTEVATLCFHERSLETARTPAEWTSLWQRTCFSLPVPAVDFQHDMVIVYFMGEQSSGGYHPEVTGVYRARGQLTVAITDHIPCGGFDVVTDPVLAIVVHKWPGPVVLERSEELQPCR